MGAVPVSHFIQNLAKPYINLNHHGLGPKGAKAIAIALVSNATVTHLELEDNWILAEGAVYLAQMLRENCCLQELNISNNHLDTEGAEAIASLLLDNMSYLHALQLSGGLHAPKQAHSLCMIFSLQSNYQVKELDLSHNEFSEKGGELLGQMLVNNVLVQLDLSSNQIDNEGAKKLCKGLEVNGNLKPAPGTQSKAPPFSSIDCFMSW
uniref:LR74A protein n=1 Tax=Dromaius novaehollandiae TaxID=8790 RepID=A0A8C4J4C1_DRONO